MEKRFIITEKGRKNGLSDDSISRDISHIVCATEYDIYGQSTLYAMSYFKDSCLVGVRISADRESEIDNYVKWYVENGYLVED
jgi:hypothetical protein